MNNPTNWATLFIYLFYAKHKFIFCKFQLVQRVKYFVTNKKHKIHTN